MSESIENIIIIKHGEGKPEGKLLPSELGFDTKNKKLYIGHEDGVFCLNQGNSDGSSTPEGSSEAVLYIEQTLTEEQKEQARKNIDAVDIKTVETLNEKLEDYINPFDLTILIDPKIAEKGSQIESLVFSWQITRVPSKIIFDGQNFEVTENSGSIILNKDNRDYFPITNNKEWVVSAVDKDGKTMVLDNNPSLAFYNGIYYGAIESNIDITSSLIKELVSQGKIIKKITGGVTVSFVPGASETQKAFFALPSNRKTPIFSVNGFDGGFFLLKDNFSFENEYGIIENYDIWVSDNTGLKTVTINVR